MVIGTNSRKQKGEIEGSNAKNRKQKKVNLEFREEEFPRPNLTRDPLAVVQE